MLKYKGILLILLLSYASCNLEDFISQVKIQDEASPATSVSTEQQLPSQIKPEVQKEKQTEMQMLIEAITTQFLSGLFDRSFFITTLMAIKYSKSIVLLAAGSSLTLVGVISVFLGVTINLYISAIWIDIFSVVLFLFFGVRMVMEGLEIQENNQQILQNLSVGDEEASLLKPSCATPNPEQEHQISNQITVSFVVFWKIFFLIFASEIGDRSQITTIYLTNNFSKYTVLFAVVFSQNLLTVLAIFGGKMISNKISERNLTIIAGSTFIVFGIVALFLLISENFPTFLSSPTLQNYSQSGVMLAPKI
jgi:putative Ca2+/H+ antiporter (TMEM165/GDT1 family)